MGLSRIFRAVAVRRPSTIVEGAEGRSKRPRRSARRGVILLGALLGAYLILGPGVSTSAVVCTYDATFPPDVTVTMDAANDDVVIRVGPGGEIQTNANSAGFANCGVATVNNTDLISVVGDADVNQDVTIDLGGPGGAFAPGATAETGNASSFEIEFDIALSTGDGDDFIILGSGGNDFITFGDAVAATGVVNLNANEAANVDHEVTFTGEIPEGHFVFAGAGDDTISGGGGAGTGGDFEPSLHIQGDAPDNGVGAPPTTVGNDTLTGGAAGDLIDGAYVGCPGALCDESIHTTDTINGGAGHDGDSESCRETPANLDTDPCGLFAADNIGAAATFNSGTINGGGGDDDLFGVEGANTLNGDAGNDFIAGGDDDDIINGGDDGDNDFSGATGGLFGGSGNDQINGGDGADKADGEDGDDIIHGNAGDDAFTVPCAGQFELKGGPGNDQVFGDAGNDELCGDDGNDLLDGGPGDDFENGQAGADRYNQGSAANGNDTISTTGGNDTGSDTVDYSATGAGIQVIVTLDGVANDGRPVPGPETDNILKDVEIVLGGPGNDDFTGDDFGDAELLVGNAGDDKLIGDADADPGDDTLRGGADADITTLTGGNGRDLLDGGAGNDTESGGGDDDVFLQGNQQVFTVPGASVPVSFDGSGCQSLTSDIVIPAATGTIRDLDVRIDAEHDDAGDMFVLLIKNPGPGEVSALLWIDETDFYDGTPDFLNTVFDDESTGDVFVDGFSQFDGRFSPVGAEGPGGYDDALEVFDHADAGGTWRLYIDNFSGSFNCNDALTLNTWSLEITLASASHNGGDDLDGGFGDEDLADYSGRTADLTITAEGGANDGQSGENDNVGSDDDDLENIFGGSGGDDITGTDTTLPADATTGNNFIRGNAGDDNVGLSGLEGEDDLWGGLGNDILNGGPDNDDLEGDDGDDLLRGGTGDDDEDGGDGNDTFDQEAAANGSDLLEGGNPTGDAFTVPPTGDTVDYSARPASNPVVVDIGAGGTNDGDPLANEDDNVTLGVDHVLGSAGPDDITGDSDSNRLVGNAGNDILDGGTNDDLLDGGIGNDAGTGGSGDDTINLGANDDQAFGDDGNDTIDGGTGNDNLALVGGNPGLNGGADDDFIRGGTGNDVANGDDGDDAVSGDEGDDTLSGNTLAGGNVAEGTPTISPDCGTTGGPYPIAPPCQPDGDTVVYFFDPGTVIVSLDPTPNDSQATDGFGDTDTLRGISGTDSTFENVHGSGASASGDIITGDDTPNFVFGEDGDDEIFGLGGADTLLGQGGDDEIHGDAGDDTLDGGTTGETDGDFLSFENQASPVGVNLALQPGIAAQGVGTGADTAQNFENIAASQGDDNIDPAGAPAITGLNGDAGPNIIIGFDGNDLLNGAAGGDILNGEDGNDVLNGGPGVDFLGAIPAFGFTEAGDDDLTGGADNDTELGGTGNDDFFQESDINGADVLTGGPPTTPPGDRVFYDDRDDPVNVNQNGIADDGEEGEGDNVTEMETIFLPRIFVMPEGATHSGFTTFLLLANPGLDTACVRITFLGPNGPLGTLPEEPVCDTSDNNDGIEILGHRRRTVNINTSLVLIGSPTPLTDVATRVFQTSGTGQVVGEVSLQKAGSLAAMNMVGSDTASNITREATWLVPEGATHSGFATFVTIANPNTSLDTHVDVDFLTGSAGTVDGPDNLLVPAGARRTVTVNAPLASGGCGCSDDVSTRITVLGDEPEVVVGMSIHRQLGADLGIGGSLGLTSAEDTWVVPEGATHSGFTTFVLLANPGVSAATVGVTYLTGSQGPVADTPVTIPAGSRTTLNVNTRLAALGKNPDDVSTLIDSTSGLVAVESTIQKADSTGFVIADSVARGGSDATDAVAGPDCVGGGPPLPCWLSPEGATHSGFVTFILVANPLPVNAEVDFLFLTPVGEFSPGDLQNFVIAPGTRRTVAVNNFVPGQDVSTLVTVEQGGVVVEMSIDRVVFPPGPGDGFSKGRSLAFSPFFIFP